MLYNNSTSVAAFPINKSYGESPAWFEWILPSPIMANRLNFKIMAMVMYEIEVYGGDSTGEVSYYITTSNNNNFDKQAQDYRIDGLTINASQPANTTIKCLVSFDGRNAWKYWNGSSWQITTLANIETYGMTTAAFQTALAGYIFQTGDTNVDFAFSLKTTDASVTPSISGVTMNYTANR